MGSGGFFVSSEKFPKLLSGEIDLSSVAPELQETTK